MSSETPALVLWRRTLPYPAKVGSAGMAEVLGLDGEYFCASLPIRGPEELGAALLLMPRRKCQERSNESSKRNIPIVTRAAQSIVATFSFAKAR